MDTYDRLLADMARPAVRTLTDDERNLMADLAHEGQIFCPECEEWVADEPEVRAEHDIPEEIEECETHTAVKEWDGSLYCTTCGATEGDDDGR